jgi:hypothetical protein
MHPSFIPACLILIWIDCSLWLNTQYHLQSLGGVILVVLAFSAWRHVWRLRLLWLGFFLSFAWGMPGDYLWQGSFSPSIQGIGHAVWQSLKVLSMIGLSNLMMSIISERSLILGFFSVFEGVLTVSMVHAWICSLRYLRSMPTPSIQECLRVLNSKLSVSYHPSYSIRGLPYLQRLCAYLFGGGLLWILNALF